MQVQKVQPKPDKSDEALIAVLDNARRLTKNAKSLYRSKNYALSVHVSILSIEECAKYLILFCRSHLPESVFRKRFQHLNKHAVSSAPWFLAGQLSVVYTVHVASQMQPGDDDLAKATRTMSEYISHYFYRNDPEAVSKSILGVLEPSDENIRDINRKANEQREFDRLLPFTLISPMISKFCLRREILTERKLRNT